MKKQTINTNQMEINKPSELTQTIFFKNDDCNAMAILTATQMDMINLIFYRSRECFIKEKVEMTEFIPFEIELAEFSKEFRKYTNGDYADLIKQLIELSNIRIVINALSKNKDLETTFTRFIHKITLSRHKHEKKKKIRIVLDGEICKMVFEVKKLFTKFYLKIQFSMVSKYSKLLYELLKDYQGIQTKVIDFELLQCILNVDTVNTKNGQWSMFNQNILTKAVMEINEKSDIHVSYEPVKERPSENARLQVTKVKFYIEKQSDSRLESLGLIQQPIVNNKYYNKSKLKLDKLVKNGYKVIDEEKWIESDIEKNTERYDAEIRIDSWLESSDEEVKKHIFELIAGSVDDCDDPMVCIDDYKIVGLFSRDTFTKNPQETIEFMNNVIESFD